MANRFTNAEAFALLERVGAAIEAQSGAAAVEAVARFGQKYGHEEVFRFAYSMAGALIDSLGLRGKEDTTFGMYRMSSGEIGGPFDAPPGQRDAPAFLKAALDSDIETACHIYLSQPKDSARAALVVQLCHEAHRALKHTRRAHLN